MANVKQLKHLEHLEDELLNYGTVGCEAIVGHFREVYNLLGTKNPVDGNPGGFVQTKWDGAPSIICGVDPMTGIFFVGIAKTTVRTCRIQLPLFRYTFYIEFVYNKINIYSSFYID